MLLREGKYYCDFLRAMTVDYNEIFHENLWQLNTECGKVMIFKSADMKIQRVLVTIICQLEVP